MNSNVSFDQSEKLQIAVTGAVLMVTILFILLRMLYKEVRTGQVANENDESNDETTESDECEDEEEEEDEDEEEDEEGDVVECCDDQEGAVEDGGLDEKISE